LAASSVAITYLNNEKGANEVVAKINGSGRKGLAIQADFSTNDAIKSMVERVEAELGAVDILVNNAGSLVERLWTPVVIDNEGFRVRLWTIEFLCRLQTG
jgi:3-oxoacyl-[acyl-carrier protein] reductase